MRGGLGLLGAGGLLALALAGAPAPASAENWVNCGKEGDNCNVPDGSHVTMRYGADGEYFFWNFEGETKIKCDNWSGDPAQGHDKACAYVSYDDQGEHWSKCDDEGHHCTVPNFPPTQVRYGKDGVWLHALRTGRFECSNDGFQYDPVKGSDKICETGGPAYAADEIHWVTCASEGQTCTINTQDPVLLRYGFGDQWTYRYATLNEIECSNDRFNIDPYKGQDKSCGYSVVPPDITQTVGIWSLDTQCIGVDCSISETLTVGTERSDSVSSSQEWSTTVTETMSAGFPIEGIGVNVEASVAASYAESSSVQQALSESVSRSYQSICGQQGSGEVKQLYQFRFDVDQRCLTEASCGGQVHTYSTLCAVLSANQPYFGPQCAPNDCANALCTECKSQQ